MTHGSRTLGVVAGIAVLAAAWASVGRDEAKAEAGATPVAVNAAVERAEPGAATPTAEAPAARPGCGCRCQGDPAQCPRAEGGQCPGGKGQGECDGTAKGRRNGKGQCKGQGQGRGNGNGRGNAQGRGGRGQGLGCPWNGASSAAE